MREALDFIERYYAERRFPPTYREIMVGLGLASPSGVSRLIDALVARGHLTFEAGGRTRRSLRPVGGTIRNVPTSELLAELARRNGEQTHG